MAVRDAIKEGGGIGPGLRGASTIPMQLAKNLYLWAERSYLRKLLEVPLAYLISALWNKRGDGDLSQHRALGTGRWS